MIDAGWLTQFVWFVRTLNDILTAGIAITAFSLLLYALSFNLRDRVARSFALILLLVVIVFTGDALASTSLVEPWVILAYQVQWGGLVFLPAAYLHLSDALLNTVGRPSRGRRRAAVWLAYAISSFFLLMMMRGRLLGSLVTTKAPFPYFEHTIWTNFFTLYYVVVITLAGINGWRAYRQMMTRSGARRMVYLMLGGTAPAMGSYPYLLYGSGFAAAHQGLFWLAVLLTNFLVGGLLVVMAYAVAFFGVTWPDRVVRARLFKWILRGPVTASVTLGVMTLVRRIGENFGQIYTAAVPFSVVVSILLMEHGISLVGPMVERQFFFNQDDAQLQLLQDIGDRLLTQSDLRQFLDTLLAAIRDITQSPFAFVAALDKMRQPDMLVISGDTAWFDALDLSKALQRVADGGHTGREFMSGKFLLLPLYSVHEGKPRLLLGLLGVVREDGARLRAEQRDALWILVERMVLALEDRILQQRIFQTLEDIQPQAEYLQKIRAAGRHVLQKSDTADREMIAFVKEALSHYWGGPKLTESPLLELQVVQKMAVEEHQGNRANALRALLRKAITQVRPDGERRFTTEWLLYNILELKFIQGQKVRDVAARLALSEADLYRKQRVAIAEVARAILSMELQAQKEHNDKETGHFDGRDDERTAA